MNAALYPPIIDLPEALRVEPLKVPAAPIIGDAHPALPTWRCAECEWENDGRTITGVATWSGEVATTKNFRESKPNDKAEAPNESTL